METLVFFAISNNEFVLGKKAISEFAEIKTVLIFIRLFCFNKVQSFASFVVIFRLRNARLLNANKKSYEIISTSCRFVFEKCVFLYATQRDYITVHLDRATVILIVFCNISKIVESFCFVVFSMFNSVNKRVCLFFHLRNSQLPGFCGVVLFV